MEQIPRSVIDSTTRMLNSVSDECRGRLRDALMRLDYTQDVATIRAQAVALMEGYCGLASDTAAYIAAQLYDGVREMELGEAMGALAESGRDPAATEGAVRAFADKLVDGDVEGFVSACLDRLDYELKVAASQTVLRNARRDPRRPRFARVPAGGETCRFCLMLAGRGFAYRNEAAASHAHANCVVAETEVAGIGLLAGMRREYKGTLVNIRTRGGRNLTVTPNHPILTTRGWVVAGEIKEFDNLICANFMHGNYGRVPDINDVPPTAKEVFESCSLMDSTLFDSVPFAAENLDGEIIGDSNIKIVNPLGFLKRAIEATADEPIEHCGFSVAQSDGSGVF